MKRFDGMENVAEDRRGRGRDPRFIRVVDVVIRAVKQIGKFGCNAPSFTNLITDPSGCNLRCGVGALVMPLALQAVAV